MAKSRKVTGLPLVAIGWHPVRWAVLAGVCFFLVTSLYLWVSTDWGSSHLESREAIRKYELTKGILFMGVTSVLLGGLVYLAGRIQVAGLMERMREQRQITVGIMASAVAHDINNVLQSTGLILEALPQTRDEDQRDVLLGQLKNSCQDLKTMAQTMRDFGKDSLPHQFDKSHIGDLLRQVTQLMAKNPLVLSKNVRVECQSDCRARVNTTMIRQAILNLFLNAAQAAPEDGTILLSVQKNHDRIQILVEDDGPGISPSKQDKLFAPYFTQSGVGTGLGLFSVMAVAELHGGTVSVSDSALGGALFTLEFPDGIDFDSDSETFNRNAPPQVSQGGSPEAGFATS